MYKQKQTANPFFSKIEKLFFLIYQSENKTTRIKNPF